MRDDAGITRLDGFALVDPNPQPPYQAAACPVIELKGQREHYGGPPVVRVTEEGDQARDEAFAESSDCQDLEHERTRFEAMDVKVENQAQRCKPRIYRVDTGTKEITDCQERNPHIISRVSSVGLDGLVAPAAGKRANQIRLFQPQATASLAGTRMLGHREPEDASTGGSPSFSRFRPSHGSAGARIERSGRPPG